MIDIKSFYIMNTVSNICGGLAPALKVLGIIYTAIKILVPIILIVVSMFELIKAISEGETSGEKIKKVVTKVIAAVLVFLVLTLTKTVVTLIDPNAENECFTYIFNIPEHIGKTTGIKLTNNMSQILDNSPCSAKRIQPRDTLELKATPIPSYIKGKKVTWESSNPDVATIDSMGKIVVNSVGDTKITAIVDNISIACTIKSVEPEYLKSEFTKNLVHTNKMLYHLYIPDKLDKRDKHPVILDLEGGGGRKCIRDPETGKYGDPHDGKLWPPPQPYFSRQISNGVKYEGAIIVSPLKDLCDYPPAKNSANPGEADRAFEILQSVVKEYNGDPDRIYLRGHSQGGAGALYLLQRHKDYFAFATVFSPANTGDFSEASFRTPMWIFASGNEQIPIQKYTSKVVEALTRNGYVFKLTILDNTGHATPEAVFPNSDLYNFILKQRRGKRVVFDPNIVKSLGSKGLLGDKLVKDDKYKKTYIYAKDY